jgi:hypothetical protein
LGFALVTISEYARLEKQTMIFSGNIIAFWRNIIPCFKARGEAFAAGLAMVAASPK